MGPLFVHEVMEDLPTEFVVGMLEELGLMGVGGLEVVEDEFEDEEFHGFLECECEW